MIQIAPQMRLLVAVEPADFRRDIDCLVRVCREALGADPFSAAAPDSGIAEQRITITAIMAFAEAPSPPRRVACRSAAVGYLAGRGSALRRGHSRSMARLDPSALWSCRQATCALVVAVKNGL